MNSLLKERYGQGLVQLLRDCGVILLSLELLLTPPSAQMKLLTKQAGLLNFLFK